MSFWKLVLNSIFHYRGINLMVLLGVALTSAILSGALVVGDSVKASLRRNAAARLSGVDTVLIGGERFFTEDLATRIDPLVAPVMQVDDAYWNYEMTSQGDDRTLQPRESGTIRVPYHWSPGFDHHVMGLEIHPQGERASMWKAHRVGLQTPIGHLQAHVPPLAMGFSMSAWYHSHRVRIGVQCGPGGFEVVGQAGQRICHGSHPLGSC